MPLLAGNFVTVDSTSSNENAFFSFFSFGVLAENSNGNALKPHVKNADTNK